MARRLRCALILLALLDSCATRFEGVPPPEYRTVPVSSLGAKPLCTFRVSRIDDLRERRGLGVAKGMTIDDTDLVPWFDHSLATIPGYTREDVMAAILIEIDQTYLEFRGGVMSANLAVRVTATSGGAIVEEKQYRGVDNSVPWTFTEGVVQEAFDHAMGSLVSQLRADSGHWC